MKKISTLIVLLITASFCFGQNIIVNGDFEIPGMTVEEVPEPWGGFKNRIVNDTITDSFAGQVENGDGSLFQEFDVTGGETYNVTFDYRWVTSAAANSTLNVRVKDANDLPTNLNFIDGTTENGYLLIDTVDTWYNGAFSFMPPADVTKVRLLFYKANGNKPLNLDNVSVTLEVTSSVADLQEFNFKAFPNPAKNVINLSATQSIDKVEVYNISGQPVISRKINNDRTQINISELPEGLYVVKAYSDESVATYKFNKE